MVDPELLCSGGSKIQSREVKGLCHTGDCHELLPGALSLTTVVLSSHWKLERLKGLGVLASILLLFPYSLSVEEAGNI